MSECRKRENVPGRSDRWSRAPPDRTSGTVLSVCGRFGIEISLVPKGELSYCWVSRPGFCVQGRGFPGTFRKQSRTCQEIRSVEPRATGSDLRHGSLCLRTFRDRDQPRPEGRAFLLLGFLSWILRLRDGEIISNERTERTCREIRSVEPRATGSDFRHGSLCLRTFRDRDQPRPEGRAFLLLGFPS